MVMFKRNLTSQEEINTSSSLLVKKKSIQVSDYSFRHIQSPCSTHIGLLQVGIPLEWP